MISVTIIVSDLSDHLACHVMLKDVYLERLPPIYKKFHMVTSKSMKALRDSLSIIEWDNVTLGKDCNSSFNEFHNILTKLLDKHIPEKECRVKRIKKLNEPWFTKSISRCSAKQLELYKKMLLLDATDADLTLYKDYRNCLRRLKRAYKLNYQTGLQIKLSQ